ncbi:riboflavin kinase/FMN adenylyltransferase [Nonlabens dokdonensis]|uniref:Riboflavin biosynthesis protein n=2 Tax=Nonlabens dokdonensis TaxID=328515 RepID=L7W3J7_NONDD|nr:bifunctional riboflavin kinase/FAD synthetase [Nonlabens dokdonensis]AGC76125.1 FAD synthase and riboflavin biosynthesis protein [Nonlabens dokdonensis DSW-6]PZX43796.1 riboflavin kinase/FMN adenylyltransferase [Nonlabens dokdonensis]
MHLNTEDLELNTYYNIEEYKATKKAVVTIGTFDGVHQGHQKILDRVVSRAKTEGLTSVLLTFFPHPRMVLQPDHDLKLINTIDERVQLVSNQGIENIVIHPFSKEFSRTTAFDYVKNILVDQLNAKVVVIGYDHRFGINRSASIIELKEFAVQFDFEVIEISKKEVEEVAVSSTKIRKTLQSGAIEKTNTYLNRDYSITGIVKSGKKIGRTIGYPTANLHVEEAYKLIPAAGVYVTSSVIDGKRVYGMTNIGTNPTVSDEAQQTIETYYIDFNEDLYNRKMELFFHKRLRSEEKFKDLEDLVAAMKQDEQKTRHYAQQTR